MPRKSKFIAAIRPIPQSALSRIFWNDLRNVNSRLELLNQQGAIQKSLANIRSRFKIEVRKPDPREKHFDLADLYGPVNAPEMAELDWLGNTLGAEREQELTIAILKALKDLGLPFIFLENYLQALLVDTPITPEILPSKTMLNLGLIKDFAGTGFTTEDTKQFKAWYKQVNKIKSGKGRKDRNDEELLKVFDKAVKGKRLHAAKFREPELSKYAVREKKTYGYRESVNTSDIPILKETDEDFAAEWLVDKSTKASQTKAVNRIRKQRERLKKKGLL
jgi:hypothetical protein